ncbi:MAG: PAS domain S-box protein [Sulfuricurvum sp.]|uniref:PAS domain S-box protein n=1 Tax=Sulfuricurvum sp. TaxID=2025608 RepID=UPI002604FF14|nr:PAS domain S-box protein [Sulfuricurvum sp.]MDD2367906.1 PAS domain S-box protein [Sulfuricurvum sp.]MDD2950823.1 PAS domain S-box protein [Sulfuricurvum sp.]MDD5118042.1 PAS domain S-box protein [Sulfuricurvum sp.]
MSREKSSLREQAEKIAIANAAKTPHHHNLSPEETASLLHELQVHQIELELQNEELRTIQQKLQAQQERYVDLYDLAPVGYITLSKEGLVLEANLRVASLFGVSRNHLIGYPLTRFIWKDDQDSYYHCRLKEVLPSEQQMCTLRMIRADGTVFWAQLIIMQHQNGIYRSVLYDVTADKKLKEIIAIAQREWTDAFDGIEDGVMLHDREYNLIRVNKAYKELSGAQKFKDIIGKPYYQVFPKLDAPMHTCEKSFRSGKGEEEQFALEDGRIFKSRTYPVYDDEGEYSFSIHIFENITEEIKSKQLLHESEEKFRTITTTAQDAILIMNDEGLIAYWNEAAENIFGYTKEETVGKALHPLLAPERFHEAHHKGFSHFIHTGEGPAIGKTMELTALKKDGTEFPIELSLSANMREGKWEAIGIIRDISQRKKAEEEINRANRALKTLSAGNMALVQAQSEENLLKRVVEVIVKEGGYSLAVVDYAQDDPEKTIIPMAWSGSEDEHHWIEKLSWNATAANQMPLSKAIRSAKTHITRNITAESEYPLWRDAALARGYTASIALPLMEGDTVFGALNIYASEANAFAEEEEEVILLEELANDLAYGIIAHRKRVAHDQHTAILRQSMEQSIETIAATVEARDPYTAGHQNRVSVLATAIARKMNLNDTQVQGIHFASIIHDLGKIHVPAEILSKPGKLTPIEFMLIQSHPQEGYDILKDVQFPWPIADIILQHHEKIDGSGYPQGLKGDQILLEAKIICVADIVEAMSSHRPYRAALGVEAALNEIKQGRGTLYDAAVADACVELFEKKEFYF